MNRALLLCIVLALSLGGRLAWDVALAPDLEPKPPRIPLSDFAVRELSNGMRAEDRPLDPEVQEVAGVDDYINRWYSDDDSALWFWVGYVSGWRPEAIHYPDACFPAQGMELATRRTIEIDLPGLAAPASFHEYEWNDAFGRRTYTLSTFYFREKFEPSTTRMRLERGLGIGYFAMITVSGPFRGDLAPTRDFYRKVLCDTIPELLKHMPSRPAKATEAPLPAAFSAES